MRSRILLVGGDPSVAAMVTDHLHDGGYEVESVAFCDHALAMLSRARVDLALILSLHVPWTMWPSSFSPEWRADIMNAILLLKHIRTLPTPPPVILMSGSPLAVVEEEALASGAFAFLRKPIALDELARFVVLALQSPKAQPTM